VVAGVERAWAMKMGGLALVFVLAFVGVVLAVNFLSARMANPVDRLFVALSGVMVLMVLSVLLFMASLRLARAS